MSPDIDGSIIGKNIKYKDFYLNEVELNGQREQTKII